MASVASQSSFAFSTMPTNDILPASAASSPKRPSLSTSLSDFALSLVSSPSSSTDDNVASGSKDDAAPLVKRMRRPTASSWWLTERVNSPLTNGFTFPHPYSRSPKRRSSHSKGKKRALEDDADVFRCDKDRMTTDSSSPSTTSESDAAPSLRPENTSANSRSMMDEVADRPKSSPMDLSRSASPADALKPPADISESTTAGPSQQTPSKRYSLPLKPSRLLSLRAEARPEENEVKHEAQVQKLLASFSGLPPGLGSSRSTRRSDRGRYPEEVGDDDDYQREDSPSDDEDEMDGDAPSTVFAYKVPGGGSEPITITKPCTPVGSMRGTPEDSVFRAVSESPGGANMDVDMPMYMGSPALSTTSIPPPQQWRQTPPPTSAASAVRTAKRKYEDRFEPYAPSAKRRAVSPSISHLKGGAVDLVSPIVIPRSPVLRPRKSFSQSAANSTASSPTVPQSQNSMNYYAVPLSSNGHGHHRSGSSSSVVSSPTVRSSMILASPVLRPVPRLAAGLKRAAEEEERIVDGTGENLRDLNIS